MDRIKAGLEKIALSLKKFCYADGKKVVSDVELDENDASWQRI